ncbi:hypothetical protein DKX38_030118 (mitochondrion) [Salix brachista]|uniref:Secreted protein n=1 Tax=Salix brachista TaxID=2182728 RepID=A0A5N5J1S5_9ROSI|nr:hypothetical protein DKX38_030118 [Salix brachista]
MALLYLTLVFNGVCSFFFGRVCQYDLNEGGADTPARITGDGYKNGGEVNSTRRHSGMNVDPSGRDNHSGPGRFSRTKKTELREAL